MKNHPKNRRKCVNKRFKAYIARVDAAGLAAPTEPDKLIPVREYTVRAHYRRHPNYMRYDPDLLQAIRDYVRVMRRKVA